MGSIMSQAILNNRGRRPAGSFNYALAARDYINLNARVGFHNRVESCWGADMNITYFKDFSLGHTLSLTSFFSLHVYIPGYKFSP
jgi:hypothetical protein